MAGVADDGGRGRETGDPSAVLGAFDQMPVMLMAMAGPDLRIAGVNAACRAFLGRTGLVGMPVRAVLPEIAGQQIFEMLDRVYATGETQEGREWRVQLGSAGGGTREAYVDFTIVPWRGPEGVITGVLASFGESTAQVLQRQEVQRQAAEAERRFLAARGVVAELQEALLPPTVPVLPWARIAARYLVAGQDQSAGGDWFDAVPLPDGTVALIVGDVVGHGAAASAAMAQLRAVLNERLLAEADLTAVIAQADAYAARTPALHAATMAVAVLDPRTGAMCYITCGHPAPLLIGSGGVTRFLPGSGTGPRHRLAAGPGHRHPAARRDHPAVQRRADRAPEPDARGEPRRAVRCRGGRSRQPEPARRDNGGHRGRAGLPADRRAADPHRIRR